MEVEKSEELVEDVAFFRRRRVLLVFLLFLGYTFGGIYRTNLSVTIVDMVENDFDWSTTQQGLALSAVFWGFMSAQIPGGVLSAKFGGSIVFGIGVLLSAIFSLLSPLAAHAGFGWFLAVRILTGMGDALSVPSSHQIVSVWIPPFERSRTTTVLYAGMFVGALVALGLSGLIINVFSWEMVFYIFGGVGVLWYLVWLVGASKTPETDRFISDRERKYIMTVLNQNENEEVKVNIPWKSILTSKAVWAIFVALFAFKWGLYTLLTQLPTFFAHGLSIDLQLMGFFALAILVVAIVFLIGTGVTADILQKYGILTTYQVRKYCTSVAFLLQAIFLLIVSFMREDLIILSFIMLWIAFGSISMSGFGVNHLDIAPRYSGVITGIASTFGTIPGIISPIIAGVIVTDQTNLDQWMFVFIIASVNCMIGSLVFWFFSSGDLQEWAKDNEEQKTDPNKVI